MSYRDFSKKPLVDYPLISFDNRYLQIGRQIYEEAFGEVLYHHGVKGQKWGVRHGPPYPLKEKIGASRASNTAKRLGDTLLSVLPGSTAIFAARGAAKRAVALAKLNADDKRRAENTNVDKESGFRLKDREYTEDEDMKMINPGYSQDVYFSDKTTTNNCAYCSAAYELRRRGYDVRAKKAESGHGVSAKDIDSLWKYKTEPKSFDIGVDKDFAGQWQSSLKTRKEAYNEIMEWTKKQPDQRGNFVIRWGYTGHSMAYEIKNGKLSIRDCQSSQYYADGGSCIRELFSAREGFGNWSATNVAFRRTDDAIPDWKKLKGLVE